MAKRAEGEFAASEGVARAEGTDCGKHVGCVALDE